MRDSVGLAASGRRTGLATRLLLLILGFSSLITLISTAAQLYVDYHRDVVAIEGRLNEIERGSLDSIAVSLWNVDTEYLRLQLEGLLRLPDMRSLEVREIGEGLRSPIVLAMGNPAGAHVISRTMPLTRTDERGTRQLGVMVATASLDGVYARLADRVALILLSQFIKTLIVSAFIFYIVHLVVTRHITAIAAHFRTMGTEADSPPLKLARRGRRDELAELVDSFNALTVNLHESYAQVSRSNARLEAAQTLADTRAIKLEEANGELRRLAMVTAHHLQEPLRPMAISAQRIQRRIAADETELMEWCASITEGTAHLGALLRDFQRYVAALTEEPRLETCDMAQLAAQARAKALERGGTEARIDLSPLPALIADKRMISQVLDELFDNALRHARPGVPPAVSLSAVRGDDCWEFTVSDNGPGFDPGIVDKVLEVFEVTHGRAPDHTGLGLPMCRAILRAHGGRVIVEPSPSGGVVRFSLPAPMAPT
ncbi:putative Signal transduction histidine kinase [Magnetospirillum sp. XM-1]|uniref:sensor histidine kinase n=1 Tax=Magnetospirillum sp. XM-1 TaxID=1663591 RepID=UPI00073DEE24|nr:ATP-binding protein [Magnetospirillum sp. XM-1]CUW40618.1 putative Signal transduction histidine kinase [Magnetospirillum sp. XM-1]